MPDSGLHARPPQPPAWTADAADALLVAGMRLVLAIAVLLALYVDPQGLSGSGDFSRPLFVAYVLHSLLIGVALWHERPWAQGKLVHWLDVGWYALIVADTNGIDSYFFLFFFFAILTTSFRWGHNEGARVTVVSAAAFALCGLLPQASGDLPRLLLRTSFLLTLGYLCAHWGQAQVRLKDRLALLRDVSQLSNPRFGVDHTLAHVLERTRAAYGASACLLVLRDADTGQACMRTARPGRGAHGVQAQALSEQAIGQLLPFDETSLILHQRQRWPWLQLGGSQACHAERARWQRLPADEAQALADLLDCQAFISAPVRLRKGQGRLYVTADHSGFSKADALFLTHIVAQAFPVIENIELLDRMASEAAAQERHKFALDLHDSAVQPYIGLKMALSALRHRAAPDNPLAGELDKLGQMADQVVADLRRYAGRVRQGDDQSDSSEPVFVSGLHQQAERVRKFYGIDMAIKIRGTLPVNDRLTAEVLQVVREGLSNICRHTLAQRGEIELQCVNGWLGIKIENDACGQEATAFTPRSITERAVALGGRAHVRQTPGGRTAIHIHIPV